NVERSERLLVRRLVAAHAYWLMRYPSLYSSANNHIIAEGVGLLAAAIVGPDLPRSQQWAGRARYIIATETLRHIYPDGVGVEQSPTYQAFTMELVAVAALIFETIGTPVSHAVTERLAVGAEFLGSLLDGSG